MTDAAGGPDRPYPKKPPGGCFKKGMIYGGAALIALVVLNLIFRPAKDKTIVDRGTGDTAQSSTTNSSTDPVASVKSDGPFDPALFEKTVRKNFLSSIVDNVRSQGTTGIVAFKIDQKYSDYFTTGDKINKVFAIESIRLFRDVPGLTALEMSIPEGSNVYRMRVSREEAEAFYGMKVGGISTEEWRTNFSARYDNKESRAEFVKKFGRSK